MPTFATPASQVSRTTDPGKVGSSEHRPASRPVSVTGDTPVSFMATPTPASARGTPESPSDLSSKVSAEMTRIYAVVFAYLRNWKANFPRPQPCTWEDLTQEERAQMRKYITAFMKDNKLVGKIDTIPASVTSILADDNFPVNEGKNSGAITSCLKVCYGKEPIVKKTAASTTASAHEAHLTKRISPSHDRHANGN